jgi:aspartyl-tRNA(Asn)/glutamyl-tRNA(Gln) amidotransferase subunit B
VCNGVRHEVNRQLNAIKQDKAVVQETRRWDADRSESFVMRSKEDAHDYRYFTDPDLCPIRLSETDIQAQKKTLPEFPFDNQERYLRMLQLPYTVTSVICPDKRLSDFFESALGFYAKNPLGIANWIANDLLRELAVEDVHQAWKNLKMAPHQVAALVKLVDSGIISKQSAKEVFDATFKTGEDPQKIVKNRGLEISVDMDALKVMCTEIIDAFPKPTEEFRSGKEKALNVLKGQVVKRTQGKVPISEVDRLLRELLSQ